MSTKAKEIFVFIERRGDAIAEVSLELLGEAGRLAQALSAEVVAVLAGPVDDGTAALLANHGAKRVLAAQHPLLGEYRTLSYTTALAQLVRQYQPEIFLFGATATGRDLAPRLSARLRTGLTADCTKLAIDEETQNLMMTRPAFGGNILATIACEEHRPQMATVRPGVMQKSEATGQTAQVTLVEVDVPASDGAVEIVETVMDPPAKKDITRARVLVSGGRGMGGPQSFEQLEEVARLLGGEVSSSRAAVDAGWTQKNQQVGQTGQTVRPDLYLASGISGAIQHVAGMEESGFIVAINKDESAPIFGVADYGVVGDWKTILPALAKELEKPVK